MALKWCTCATAMTTELAVPRPQLGAGDCLVVKVGSSLLASATAGLDAALIENLAAQVAAVRARGLKVVLVSSGAVAAGIYRLGLPGRPDRLHRLQAAAAVGQTGLVRAYEEAFARHDLRTALVLLTHADLASRERYLNASSTLKTLLELGVVPVINENDTVATEEIQFGDNDTLGALVANLLQAPLLLLLTDQQGLHLADPRSNPDAPLLSDVTVHDPALEGYCAAGPGELGRGGMLTKVRAARQAARSGAVSIVASGRDPQIMAAVIAGERVGTAFHPDASPLAARKGWLSGQVQVAGTVTVDSGAVRALTEQGRSLLPVGVVAVDGNFRRGDLVRVVSEDGTVVAQGLSNYASDEAQRLQGVVSADIAAVLGYCNEHELLHRDNLALLNRGFNQALNQTLNQEISRGPTPGQPL